MRWVVIGVCALAVLVGGRLVVLGTWSPGLVTLCAVGLLLIAALVSMGLAAPRGPRRRRRVDGDEVH